MSLRVAGDDRVGQRGRAEITGQPTAGVAADGAVGQREGAAWLVKGFPFNTPLPMSAELPLTVQLVSVGVPVLYRPPPPTVGGVAADGAVGQRGRAEVGQAAAVVPALPPVIVRPEMDAVTPASTWNTRLSPPPLTVTPAAGPVIVSVSLVLLSSSWRAGQGDRLRRGEDGRVEGDGRVSRGIEVGEGDGLGQAQEARSRGEGIARRIHDQGVKTGPVLVRANEAGTNRADATTV